MVVMMMMMIMMMMMLCVGATQPTPCAKTLRPALRFGMGPLCPTRHHPRAHVEVPPSKALDLQILAHASSLPSSSSQSPSPS
eukprot:4283096-Karenia_brevis.AAC.1